jgi:hypothetical protein
MSAFLYDKDNNIVMKGRELQTVHSFAYKRTFRTLGYGLIRLTSEGGIADTLSAMVERYHGDGIINLSVSVQQGLATKLSGALLWIPTWLPFFPGSADVTIRGEIVKLAPSGMSLNGTPREIGLLDSRVEIRAALEGAFHDTE